MLREKKTIYCLLLFLLIANLSAAKPSRVHAASNYKVESSYDKAGTIKFFNASTGKSVGSVSIPGYRAGYSVINSGKTIYFTAGLYSNSVEAKKSWRLYSYNVSTGTLKKLKNLTAAFWQYDPEDIYDGSIYLSGWDPSDKMAAYRYNLKSGKVTKIASAGYSSRYKNYIVCESTDVHGAYAVYPIYVYNTKTGKTKKITSMAGANTQNGKYLYIAQAKTTDYPSSAISYKIIRYTLTTGAKKTMVSSMKTYFISKITAKYVYSTGGYPTSYYRYNISTKKTSKISQEAFRKAVG